MDLGDGKKILLVTLQIILGFSFRYQSKYIFKILMIGTKCIFALNPCRPLNTHGFSFSCYALLTIISRFTTCDLTI